MCTVKSACFKLTKLKLIVLYNQINQIYHTVKRGGGGVNVAG